MKELFDNGGLLMYPLAICLMISIIITIERSIFWIRNGYSKNISLLNQMLFFLKNNNEEEFLKSCKKSSYLINRLLLKLINVNSINYKSAAEIEITKEYSKLRRGHIILDTIISVSPMIGILGTVIGIILSFQAMSVTGMDDPKAVTGGIGQALITTASGLVIAIFTLLVYNFFNSKISSLTNEIEIFITELEIHKYSKNLPDSIKGFQNDRLTKSSSSDETKTK